MPRYEHKCIKDHCEFLFEVTYGIKEEPKINCPKCASPTQRQISRNVMFETPIDVEWEKDPNDLSVSSYKKYTEAKKRKYRW
tara:strand:- start:102 stop:347 length:246 start_codon:yes stop_codon:yes gene_type:complete